MVKLRVDEGLISKISCPSAHIIFFSVAIVLPVRGLLYVQLIFSALVDLIRFYLGASLDTSSFAKRFKSCSIGGQLIMGHSCVKASISIAGLP